MGPVAGIDLGSMTAAVVLLWQGEILQSVVRPTGANVKATADRALNEALAKANLKQKDLKMVIATGYGRISVNFADKKVTEITCHARGAYSIDRRTRTVIDIGGQDSKVISLTGGGQVLDFAMNDKCAAGTGRFLEVMAHALEIEVDQLADLSDQAVQTALISSMCTVFAESEVVSLIAQGVRSADIARGLHEAVAERTISLVKRVGLGDQLMMTGGVAKNHALVNLLREKLAVPVIIPPEPQIIGALGAALIAEEEFLSNR